MDDAETSLVASEEAEKPRWNPNPKGRTPARIKYADLLNRTEAEMFALLELVPQSIRDLIEGVLVEEEAYVGRGKTETRIYRRPPDINAIKLLLDRTLGKTVIPIMHEGTVTHELDTGHFNAQERLALLEMAANAERRKLENTVEGVILSEAEEEDEE